MLNVMKPYWFPGDAITGHATENVTGRRFIRVSGPRTDEGFGPCNPSVAHATAGNAVLGVSTYDAPQGQKVTFHTDGVLEVEAGAAITAGAFVASDADGRATTATDRASAVGIALDNAAAPSGGTYATFAVHML